MRAFAFGLIVACFSAGCSTGASVDKTDTTAIADGDADTDTDTDSDVDADSDTDVDADSDTDTDTDTDTVVPPDTFHDTSEPYDSGY